MKNTYNVLGGPLELRAVLPDGDFTIEALASDAPAQNHGRRQHIEIKTAVA